MEQADQITKNQVEQRLKRNGVRLDIPEVLDDDYVNGIAKNIAHDLNLMTSKIVNVIGLKDKSAGFYPQVDNLPPTSNEIRALIYKIIKKQKSQIKL